MRLVAAYAMHVRSACCCQEAESYSQLSDASVVVRCWRSCCRRPVSSLPSEFKPGSYGLHSMQTHDTIVLLIHPGSLDPDLNRSDRALAKTMECQPACVIPGRGSRVASDIRLVVHPMGRRAQS